MTRSRHIFLTSVLAAGLVRPARAETITAARDQLVTGIVVVGAAIAVGVILLVRHEKHKPIGLTGCVRQGTTGMTVSDESDHRTYTSTGDSADLKPGDRMTLKGKRAGGKPPLFEVRSVTKDHGPCQV